LSGVNREFPEGAVAAHLDPNARVRPLFSLGHEQTGGVRPAR